MNKALTTLRTASELATAGLIAPSEFSAIEAVAQRYAIAITPTVAALVDTSDPSDPIARQFVPSAAELNIADAERPDPIGDFVHAPVKGIVHRYPDRVLLKLATVCPVYCRFCFRRESVGKGEDATLTSDEFAAALDYIRSKPQIFEVIVTGGDPLILSSRRIAEVTAALSAIAHVAVIRWHTRVPVVAPERVSAELVAALRSHSKAIYVALHCNHPRELTTEARTALGRLADAGIGLVSQSVLLAGINDDVETLEALMRALLAARVKPYYLHHGDLAPGTAHFRTTIAKGQALMRALRGRLSGLALPVYVLDIPGGYGKVPVDSSFVSKSAIDDGSYTVIDPNGERHSYRDVCADPTL